MEAIKQKTKDINQDTLMLGWEKIISRIQDKDVQTEPNNDKDSLHQKVDKSTVYNIRKIYPEAKEQTHSTRRCCLNTPELVNQSEKKEADDILNIKIENNKDAISFMQECLTEFEFDKNLKGEQGENSRICGYNTGVANADSFLEKIKATNASTPSEVTNSISIINKTIDDLQRIRLTTLTMHRDNTNTIFKTDCNDYNKIGKECGDFQLFINTKTGKVTIFDLQLINESGVFNLSKIDGMLEQLRLARTYLNSKLSKKYYFNGKP